MGLWLEGLEFRDWGLGFGGLGFRGSGFVVLGFEVWGRRVRGLGFGPARGVHFILHVLVHSVFPQWLYFQA